MKRQLIKHVDVFDGTHEVLLENGSIVVEDNLVREIVQGDVVETGFDTVIDGAGLTAIPGLTDAHVHLIETADLVTVESMRMDETAVRSWRNAYEMLLRGFTTVRDAGGTVLGVKKSIDNGYVDGPRIFPSNGAICQTSGHCDARGSQAQRMYGFHSTSPVMNNGNWVIADGVPEVLKAVREQLFLGASQIKLMLNGGVASFWDKLWTLEYTHEEIRAAVDAATDFGTYVMAHLYTAEAMKRAGKAGVRCFEHGQLMDEDTAKMMRDYGIWLCPCPQFDGPKMDNFTPEMAGKMAMVQHGVERQTEYVNKYGLQIVFGTDFCGTKERAREVQLSHLRGFKKHYGSFEGLKAATGNVHELLKLTTYQNPYPEGKIGVLEAGSFADVLLVRGNPVEDLDLLADRENMRLIMKDGKIYKNLIDGRVTVEY